MDVIDAYGTGALLAVIYIIMGIGFTRIFGARFKHRGISVFEILFWPVCLAIIAVAGDVARHDE